MAIKLNSVLVRTRRVFAKTVTYKVDKIHLLIFTFKVDIFSDATPLCCTKVFTPIWKPELKGVSFYGLPLKNKKLLKQWLIKIRRENILPHLLLLLCIPSKDWLPCFPHGIDRRIPENVDVQSMYIFLRSSHFQIVTAVRRRLISWRYIVSDMSSCFIYTSTNATFYYIQPLVDNAKFDKCTC